MSTVAPLRIPVTNVSRPYSVLDRSSESSPVPAAIITHAYLLLYRREFSDEDDGTFLPVLYGDPRDWSRLLSSARTWQPSGQPRLLFSQL